MNKKIEAHVNALFENAPKGSHTLDIKEELLANLNDKYNDMTASGKSEDEAFAVVISGIGDINKLLEDLGESQEYRPLEMAKKQQLRGVFISIGIALYVLSVIPVILLGQTADPNIGVVLMFIICAAATAFVVFGNTISKNKYHKADNSFVEEYKEKIAYDNDRGKLRNAITSSMWSLIVVFYLAISFITNWWHISWIIFLIGSCLQQFIIFGFAPPEKRKHLWHGILWTATVVVYFIISFATWAWAWSWMIFLVAVSVQQIIRLLILWKKAD